MPSFTRFVISQEKVCTLLYWKAGEVTFYRKNDRSDEGFEMQGLIPWQKTIKEELENHFGYGPSSVSFRVVIKKDREGHSTFFLCPHRVANKLMWKDLQLFKELVTYVSLKCNKCIPQGSHQAIHQASNHQSVVESVKASAKKSRSNKRHSSRANSSLSPPPIGSHHPKVADFPAASLTAPQAEQISPEDFMSSISEECDRFKETIMGRISDYFKTLTPNASRTRQRVDSDSDEDYNPQSTSSSILVKDEPAERSLISGSSTNLRPRRATQSSSNIAAWSWADDEEIDVKYDYNGINL